MEQDDESDWRSSRYDPNIQLGMPRAGRLEYGESIVEYYRRKHSQGRYGKYYGLHHVAPAGPWRLNNTQGRYSDV